MTINKLTTVGMPSMRRRNESQNNQVNYRLKNGHFLDHGMQHGGFSLRRNTQNNSTQDAPKFKTRMSPIKTNILSSDHEIINLDLNNLSTKNQNQKIFQKARHSVQPNSIPLPTLNVKNEARM